MSLLLAILALLTGLAGLFTYQWITFFPRLGIGYLYHIRWVKAGFTVTTVVLALAAYLLDPSAALLIVLGLAVVLGLLSGANRANRVVVALDRP